MRQCAITLLFVVLVAVCASCESATNRQNRESLSNARQLDRGKTILEKLATLSPEDAKKLPIDAYRGERVAFQGSCAPSGATSDLMTDNGYYLRVVNPQYKDLRPHALAYEATIYGEILQVLPLNKIIVIEVNENDFLVGDTY